MVLIYYLAHYIYLYHLKCRGPVHWIHLLRHLQTPASLLYFENSLIVSLMEHRLRFTLCTMQSLYSDF